MDVRLLYHYMYGDRLHVFSGINLVVTSAFMDTLVDTW
jgi:hypothetical protein